MNAILDARVRAMNAKAQRLRDEEPSWELFKELIFPKVETRSKEEYEKLLVICKACSDDDRCPICRCKFEPSLMNPYFECGKGKF